jgi:membrane protease YdiL (CAAX protease family)
LAVEYTALFIVLPSVSVLGYIPIYPLFALWIFAAVCFIALIFDRRFEATRIWRASNWKPLGGIFVRFCLATVLLGCYVVIFEPDLLFDCPRKRTFTWAIVMILYPLLSVYPQGMTHRAFLFHRYRNLFKGWSMVLASATAFSYMHIVFKNPLALLLTFAGGVLFAKTYKDTDSLITSSIEHTLYGNYLFTIGLGKYLYLGNAGYA